MRALDACRAALRVAVIGAVGWAVAGGGQAQAAPIVLFSDTFQRSNSDSLGSDWMEAEAAATQFRISSGQALLDVAMGPSGGVDFAHAVTVPTFVPAGLGVQAETQEMPMSGFTIRYGLGFATTADDDLDLIFFSLQGQPLSGGGAAFEVFLTTPDPAGPGSVTYFLAHTDPLAPAVNAFTRDTLTLSINPGATGVQALFNDRVLLTVPLDPADLPDELRVKIGNPGADMDTSGGSGRSGDVFYDNVVVTRTLAVPEPSALLLLVSALAGLASRRLRP